MRPKKGRILQIESSNNKSIFNRSTGGQYRNVNQLSEEDVGISVYLGNTEGFTGVIKARYSDFQLNEIDLDGNVAKLTDTSIPADFSLKLVQFNYKEVVESPNKHIPQDIWESIKIIVEEKSGVTKTLFIDAENIDKNERRELHECIKKHFGNKVLVSTEQVDNKRRIKIEKYRKEADSRTQWPEDKGEHVHFVVYKEKMDTMEVLFRISSAVGIGASHFHHAGTKDKRAISSQWFSVKKVPPWKLITKTKKLHNVHIGNITFKDAELRLGDLKGNKFRIALRNVNASDGVVENAVKFVKENGFVNFYGLQRFGNDKEVPTYQVGISLLLGKWEEAVNLILKVKQSDDATSFQGDIVRAKKIYGDTKNAAKAYDALQRNKTKSVEGKLLEGLKHSKQNDYVTALERVPRSMRLLYLHAFQSLIWNKMVSKRLQLWGMKPVVGDFVLLNEESDVISEAEDEEEADGGVEEIPKDGDVEEAPKDGTERNKKRVKAVTKEELGDYTMFDVVLPLPGYNVTYPDHMKDAYKECLNQYGLELEMAKQKVRSYSLSGDYRKILEKVEDVTWRAVKYNNPTDDLILSDWQELQGKQLPDSADNGQYKAVILEFSLPASSYATMVLREIMKVETSSNVQSQLNNYHESNTKSKENVEAEDGSSFNGDNERARLELIRSVMFGDKRPSEDEAGGSSKKLKVDGEKDC